MKKELSKITTLIQNTHQSDDIWQGKSVNPPVVRTSTVVFSSHQAWVNNRKKRDHERILSYGARGTQTHFELEKMVANLESAAGVQLCPTGLAALSFVLICMTSSGGHILITDGIYGPVRSFCEKFLKKNNVTVDFIKADACDVEEKITHNTQLILAETPGSILYEMIDLPKLSQIAKKYGVPLAVDNTYGSAYFYNPLTLGADISIVAGTKYLSGHSDVMMGLIAANDQYYPIIKDLSESFGLTTSPDDAYTVLKGIRTLDVRLMRHQKNALKMALWLQKKKEVKTVFHPALPSHLGHKIWKRDFTGANGMLTFEFTDNYTKENAIAFVDDLKLFSIGASWGGYESIATYVEPHLTRTRSNWSHRGPFVRMHIGLENIDDLIEDATQAFNKIIPIGE